MITKITTLDALPPPIRAVVAQANAMSNNFANLTGGKVSTKAFPDVYRMETSEQLIRKAREIDAELQPMLDIERAKSKGKTKRGAGHLRRAYLVAVRLAYNPIDEITGEEHYNTEVYYCEVTDIHELERLDRERKTLDDAERSERLRKQQQQEIAREAARERRKFIRSKSHRN